MKKGIFGLLLIMVLSARSQSTRAGSYLPANVSGGQNVINSSVVWDSACYLIDTVTSEVFVWGHASASVVGAGTASIKFTPPFPMLTPPPYGREMARGQGSVIMNGTLPYASCRVRVNSGGQFLVEWYTSVAGVSQVIYYSYQYTIQ